MGHITRFDLNSLKEKNKLTVAVETGTHSGSGARFLANYFNKVHTIDIIEEFYNNIKNDSNKNIIAHLGKSVDCLPSILDSIGNERCLFWLDAHLPSHYKDGVYGDLVELPLEQELKTICKHKNVSNDCFIIDDLRIYEDGPFSGGNWEGRKQFSNSNGIKFIYDLFSDTHKIDKLYDDQGYIILTPLT